LPSSYAFGTGNSIKTIFLWVQILRHGPPTRRTSIFSPLLRQGDKGDFFSEAVEKSHFEPKARILLGQGWLPGRKLVDVVFGDAIGMRYYKQFHDQPYVHWVAWVVAGGCLILALFWKEPATQVKLLICAVFVMIAAGMMWKGRRHYLEIDRGWIVHHGFKRWRIKRADVVRVEHGKKGLLEDYDLFLKVHGPNCTHDVDDGFLINEQHVEELANAILRQAQGS
jgi:hypothetical protein